MTAAIEAVKAELESARHALRGAEEAYSEAEAANLRARRRLELAYEGRAATSRNVDRLEKALALLEGETDD